MEVNLTGLAKRLVNDNVVVRSQVLHALRSVNAEQGTFVSNLLMDESISDVAIAKTAAAEFRLPIVDLSAFDSSLIPQQLVSGDLIRKHRVLPILQKAQRLILATSDPSNLNGLQEIGFHSGSHCEYLVVADKQLQCFVDQYLAQLEDGDVAAAGNKLSVYDELNILPEEAETSPEELKTEDEAPIVRFVNKILLDSIKNRASDVHIESYENVYRIRFRIDGILHTVTRPPIKIATRIASRIKVMAKLDISEKRLPQDGRIKVKLSQRRTINFRVNCLPTAWGEKIVLRLLDPQAAKIGISALGYDDWQREQFLKAITRTQGMVLLTGPTGSGKSVSLYAALDYLNSPDKNILTIEDPVEISFEGINQLAINPRIGLDFATALRSILRQDPDVIMVGEIRDSETAEIAIKAAQTGHLVFSTLHTNSAAETLSRLRLMGIPSYNLATAVHLIIAQRLVRRLCDNCKESVELPEKLLMGEGFKAHEINSLRIYRAVGCERCRDGYAGRLGIYEVVPITAELSRLIMDGGNTFELADLYEKAGFESLRTAALNKVGQGLTSLEEALRMT